MEEGDERRKQIPLASIKCGAPTLAEALGVPGTEIRETERMLEKKFPKPKDLLRQLNLSWKDISAEIETTLVSNRDLGRYPAQNSFLALIRIWGQKNKEEVALEEVVGFMMLFDIFLRKIEERSAEKMRGSLN